MSGQSDERGIVKFAIDIQPRPARVEIALIRPDIVPWVFFFSGLLLEFMVIPGIITTNARYEGVTSALIPPGVTRRVTEWQPRPKREVYSRAGTCPQPGTRSAKSLTSMPKDRPRRLNSIPSSRASPAPSRPYSETWLPVPLGMGAVQSPLAR